MNILETSLPGVLLIEPDVYGDERGFFLETFNRDRFSGYIDDVFVQDNHSRSGKNILRGLHAQNPHQQGKLVRVTLGEVFDVAVDVRRGSPSFGQWFGEILSADNFRMVYVPAGFAHGFCVLSETADFQYKCTDTYHPDDEFVLAWDDPDIGIEWPLSKPVLSARDQQGATLQTLAASGRLPEYDPVV